MKMKILLLCFGALLFAEESWIQVLSIKKDGVVAPALLERIKRNGFSYEVVEEGDAKKVRLGSFATLPEAKSVLPVVRCKIASDAFIVRRVPVPLVEVVPASMAVVAHAAEKEHRTFTSETMTGPEIREEKNGVAAGPCICICDKKALRKAEIGTAMDFYRNSPDYRFTGVEEK